MRDSSPLLQTSGFATLGTLHIIHTCVYTRWLWMESWACWHAAISSVRRGLRVTIDSAQTTSEIGQAFGQLVLYDERVAFGVLR